MNTSFILLVNHIFFLYDLKRNLKLIIPDSALSVNEKKTFVRLSKIFFEIYLIFSCFAPES